MRHHIPSDGHGYLPVTLAKSNLVSTIHDLDRDLQRWSDLQDALDPRSKNDDGHRRLLVEFAEFFEESAKIRQTLAGYLTLLNTIVDN